MFKDIVNKNIQSAEKRRDAFIKKTPDDIYSIRFWDGYIVALNTLVSLLPEDPNSEDVNQQNNEDEWWQAIK